MDSPSRVLFNRLRQRHHGRNLLRYAHPVLDFFRHPEERLAAAPRRPQLGALTVFTTAPG
jgi:hypothetical protein